MELILCDLDMINAEKQLLLVAKNTEKELQCYQADQSHLSLSGRVPSYKIRISLLSSKFILQGIIVIQRV